MKKLITAIALLSTAVVAGAQNPDRPEPQQPQRFYKLQFQIEQFEGNKPIKSQEVSAIAPVGRSATHIRSGEKVPYASGEGVSYQDVGLNVDCLDVEQTGTTLRLALQVEVSTAVAGEAGKLPLLRQYRWQSDVSVPIGKTTTVFADNNSSSQYKMDVKVTAAPLDSPAR